MRKGWLLVLLLVSISVVAGDSIQVEKAQQEQSWLQRTISGFTRIDENYVEPQHYDWSRLARISDGDGRFWVIRST